MLALIDASLMLTLVFQSLIGLCKFFVNAFPVFLLIMLEKAIHVSGNFLLIFLKIFIALFNRFMALVRSFFPT